MSDKLVKRIIEGLDEDGSVGPPYGQFRGADPQTMKAVGDGSGISSQDKMNDAGNAMLKFQREGRAVEMGVSDADVDAEQLKMGVQHEMEHTSDPELSRKIALDHLASTPDYYTRLTQMEQDAKASETPATREPYHSLDMHDEPGEDDGY